METTKPIRYFKVKAGIHLHGDREYKTGDVVESRNNLVKLFANKFEEVPAPASPPPTNSSETEPVVKKKKKAIVEDDE